jgi:Protein kinase domain
VITVVQSASRLLLLLRRRQMSRRPDPEAAVWFMKNLTMLGSAHPGPPVRSLISCGCSRFRGIPYTRSSVIGRLAGKIALVAGNGRGAPEGGEEAYVAGPSLAQAVTGHGPLPAASVVALAAGLAESLTAIHAAGVVHRDLKPSNVLLAEDGPRVIDSGISHAAEATSLTRAGLVMGSAGFMSPEQAEGGDVGPPSDVFSLGAVLVFAATGKGPFGTGSTAALVYRVVHGPANLDGVPGAVRPLAERCLAKDPAQRPSAGDLLAEVGAASWPQAGCRHRWPRCSAGTLRLALPATPPSRARRAPGRSATCLRTPSTGRRRLRRPVAAGRRHIELPGRSRAIRPPAHHAGIGGAWLG